MGNTSAVLIDQRAKLSKVGKKLLDECVEECRNKQLSDEDTVKVVTERLSILLKDHALPSIRLIKYDDIVLLGTFPRCPENISIVCDLDKIDRNNSLLVFISHCWLRGWSGAAGWNGQPHPDNAAGDKYRLCVRGIKKLKDLYAPRMKECYVWLDFGCINQDGNPAGELEQLDKIVQCCDCIFTPIVDKDHEKWSFPTSGDYFRDYQAKLWNDGPHAYLNRGWCRVEMLYAANIPVQENTAGEDGMVVHRHTMFETGLAYHCKNNRRPHFIFGDKEYSRFPIILPPLQHSYLTEYSPVKGSLSVAADMEHIQTLMSELQPYLDANKITVGYKGDMNDVGLPHGYGVHVYESGAVCEGQWQNGKMHGHGTYRNVAGDVFEGEYVDGQTHGHGVYRYASGAVYEGEYQNDLMHGLGKFRYDNGNVYKGEFERGLIHGKGVFSMIDGSEYDGDWQEGKMHGRGVYRDEFGDVFEGHFKNNRKYGHGVYHYPTGDMYVEIQE